ncbi:hypothetical protein NSQ14_15790 [Caldifermentibacillus hisashii]
MQLPCVRHHRSPVTGGEDQYPSLLTCSVLDGRHTTPPDCCLQHEASAVFPSIGSPFHRREEQKKPTIPHEEGNECR